MLTTTAARALSVIGHPALLMPSTVAWAASIRGASPEILRQAIAASVFVAVSVVVYSAIQVRTGRWQHVDASIPRERGQLNLFLAVVLLGAAALVGSRGDQQAVAMGLAFGGAIVVFAILSRRWLKLSLHAAFAVFAAALLWPHLGSVLLVLVLAAGVSWSRLTLRRHTASEVMVGLLLGGVVGLAFNLLAV